MFAGLFGFGGLGEAVDWGGYALIALGMAIIWGLPDTSSLFYDWLDPAMIKTAGLEAPRAKALRWKPIAPVAFAASLLLFVCVLNASKVAPFIYFQF
jgi:hypothetical protein